MSLYRLNLLVQDYPILKYIIQSVQLIGEDKGGMGKQTIVEVQLKEFCNRE